MTDAEHINLIRAASAPFFIHPTDHLAKTNLTSTPRNYNLIIGAAGRFFRIFAISILILSFSTIFTSFHAPFHDAKLTILPTDSRSNITIPIHIPLYGRLFFNLAHHIQIHYAYVQLGLLHKDGGAVVLGKSNFSTPPPYKKQNHKSKWGKSDQLKAFWQFYKPSINYLSG
jgi:hypothetical protein